MDYQIEPCELTVDRSVYVWAGWTYIISGQTTGLVKIGQTCKHVRERLAALQTGSPIKLTLEVAIPGRAAERELHERFAHLRQHGEWFTSTPALIAYARRRAYQEVRQLRRAELRNQEAEWIKETLNYCSALLGGTDNPDQVYVGLKRALRTADPQRAEHVIRQLGAMI